MHSRRIVPLSLSFISLLAASPMTDRAIAQTPAVAPRVLASFSGRRNEDESPSPDGRWLFHSAGKQIAIYDIASKSSAKIADMPGWESSWSPRGDAVAFVRGDDNGENEYVWYVAIDPRSGKPASAPRRVSTGQGEFPAISNDGKLIAYSMRDTGKTYDLVVMPVNGGKQRIVAHIAGGFESVNWSADDKFIFFNGPLPGKPQLAGVLKVGAAGGTPRLIGPPKVWLAGMTQDHRYLVTVPESSPVKASDRAIVIDTDGREVGAVALPVGEISEYAGVIGDSSLVWVQIVDHKTITVRDANGAAHEIPLIGRSDLWPHWAPDARRLSFLVQEGGTYSLAISGANGEQPAVFHDTDVRAGDWTSAWSPDGRSIAYEKSDRHSVWLLDVATGKSRRIFNDTIFVPGPMVWRDNNAGVRLSAGRSGQPSAVTVFDVSVDGRRRQLANLSGILGSSFLDANERFVRDDSTASVVSLSTGARTLIARIDPAAKLMTLGVSEDKHTVVGVLSPEKGGPRNRIEVVSIPEQTRRVQVLPFVIDQFGHFPKFTANSSSVLLFGKNAADSTTKLYEIPLAGGNARIVADVGSVPRDESVAVSTDGRLAYTVQSTPSQYNLLLVDLPAAARQSASRPARP